MFVWAGGLRVCVSVVDGRVTHMCWMQGGLWIPRMGIWCEHVCDACGDALMTLETSQDDRSWLKEVASQNISLMSVTCENIPRTRGVHMCAYL